MKNFTLAFTVFLTSSITLCKAQCAPTTTPTQAFAFGVYTVSPNNTMVTRQICSNTTLYDTIGGGTQKTYYMEPGANLFLKNHASMQVYMRGNSVLTVIQQTVGSTSVYKEATAVTNGTFSPAVTNCSLVTFPTIACNAPTGLTENLRSNFISFYPNPAHNQITINNDSDLSLSAVLINSLGQKVKSFTIEDKTKTVDVSELNEGIYILSVSNNKNLVFTHRLILLK